MKKFVGILAVAIIAFIAISEAKICANCEGCDLLGVKTKDLESTAFQFPAATTSGVSAPKAESIQKTFKKFVSLAMGISHFIPPPFGGLIRGGHGVMTSIIALSMGPQDDTWEKIETKVEAKIEGYVTYGHFTELSSFWDTAADILAECPEDLTIAKLKQLMSQKKKMFPQNNLDTSFTTHFVTALNTWLMYISAMYLELMRQGKIPECALAEEMEDLRPDIVNALKALQIKRWRAIRGYKYDTRAGRNKYTYASLQYQDQITEEKWPKNWKDNHETMKTYKIQKTKEKTFKMIDDSTALLIDPLRKRFNELLNVLEDAFEGCPQVIEKIPWQASYLEWPVDCYGTPKDSDDQPCLLPCDLYSYGSYWCPNEDALKYYPDGSQPGKIHGGNNNVECDPPNGFGGWDQCAHVPPVGKAKIYSAPWRYDRKKNQKSKKSKKTKDQS